MDLHFRSADLSSTTSFQSIGLPRVDDVHDDLAQKIKDSFDINETNVDNDTELLDHLGDYTEEPFSIIESYFQGKHLECSVRHQIESYNHFVNYQIQKTIQMFNPVSIHSENDYVPEKDKYFLEVEISFHNFKLYPPQIHENNGATKTMFPQEAKLRNFSYSSTMTVDIHIQYIIRNTEQMETPKIIEKVIPKINIGKMPIMLKSAICILKQNQHLNILHYNQQLILLLLRVGQMGACLFQLMLI